MALNAALNVTAVGLSHSPLPFTPEQILQPLSVSYFSYLCRVIRIMASARERPSAAFQSGAIFILQV